MDTFTLYLFSNGKQLTLVHEWLYVISNFEDQIFKQYCINVYHVMICKRWVLCISKRIALCSAPYNYFSKLWNLNRACEKFNLEHIYVTAQALDKDKSENFILYSSSSCKTYCLFFSQDIPLLGGRSVDVEKISQCTLKKKNEQGTFYGFI